MCVRPAVYKESKDSAVSLGVSVSSERELTPCQRHQSSVQPASSGFGLFRPRPAIMYVPQCDEHGSYESTQCHTAIGQCWCVDADGQEIPNTRTGPGNTPLCESLRRDHLQILS